MASITHQRSTGKRLIQFQNLDGRRATLRLGSCSKRRAEEICRHIEELLAAKSTGTGVSRAAAEWLRAADGELVGRLAKLGLTSDRDRVTLGGFVDDYISSRQDVKASTRTVYLRTRRHLADFFSETRRLDTIRRGDADLWRSWLVADRGLAENTVRRTCGIAKQFMRAAVRRGLIPENAFEDQVVAVRPNTARFYFVTRQEAEAVLDACPDDEWRLLFALARFGGLRTPSEPLRLRWRDIDWAGSRFTVHASKSEHHAGGGIRVVPIFPELRPHFEAARRAAARGEEHVIRRYRQPAVNLRTQLDRVIRRAGLKPWPKRWQNLRSTRETELLERFPIQVVTSWLGNSPMVALRHYLQVTDDHYEVATSGDGRAAKCAAASAGNVAQRAVNTR
ncbi:MAG: tyrosine-type recombinase/integrase [Planctomycetota bacterium]